MIVVDANVIAYLHISGEFTQVTLSLLREDPHWIAPPLWQSEFRNVLVNYVRHHVMTLEAAAGIMEQALSTMQGREITPIDTLVLSLAVSSRCSSYDCEYVALAREMNLTLVTFDRQVVGAFPGIAVFPHDFVNL